MHDKLVQLFPKSFKQCPKINPVAIEPDRDQKRGENDEENRLSTNLEHLEQKLNLWPVPLKSSGSKFQEGRGGGVILQDNVKYLL